MHINCSRILILLLSCTCMHDIYRWSLEWESVLWLQTCASHTADLATKCTHAWRVQEACKKTTTTAWNFSETMASLQCLLCYKMGWIHYWKLEYKVELHLREIEQTTTNYSHSYYNIRHWVELPCIHILNNIIIQAAWQFCNCWWAPSY